VWKQHHQLTLRVACEANCSRLNIAWWGIPASCHMNRPMASRPELSLMAVVGLILIVSCLSVTNPQASASAWRRKVGDSAPPSAALEQAQRFFYNGNYEDSAAAADALCVARPEDLDACELRTASLLFQIKGALGETSARDKTTAWKQCAACPTLMSAFLADTVRGQTSIRDRLTVHPDDEDALFFLGKLDLNYVWVQLGMLGRKTGWDEYWEARRSLDRVLEMNPAHVRARVARGWVDYIVGSTVPKGVRWLLGGGNKKRGLLSVREVAERGDAEFFDRVEAMFALWDMQVREREFAGAVASARTLARDFPEKRELRKFLATHDPTALVIDAELPTP